MSSIHKNELGFVAFELLLVLLIAAIVGFVGLSVWKYQHQSRAAVRQTTASPHSKIPAPTSSPVTFGAPITSSGVKGVTTYGSASGCYSQDPNSSCGGPRPVQAVIEFWSPVEGGTDNASRENVTSKKIGSVNSDAKGEFSISLPPGRYFLMPQPLPSGQVASTQTVVVAADQYIQVTILYD